MPKPAPAVKLVERSLTLNDQEVPVAIRLDRRARRISVRVDPSRGQVQITAPPRAGITQALAFAQSQERWIGQRLARVPEALPFVDGGTIPYLGQETLIRHRADRRGTVWLEDGVLCVAGAGEHLPRRLGDWLKARAREQLSLKTAHYATRLGLDVPKIQIRDGTSRWGSCSPSGVISYSWRLILAPPFVLDYVAAHEVCHLRHMDHSDRFWRLLATLVDDDETPRAWLRAYGVRLHRVGQVDGASSNP